MNQKFLHKGYTSMERLIPSDEVEKLKILYDDLLNDKKRTAGLRSDLSGNKDSKDPAIERIIQIMRPSLVESKLLDSIAYARATSWVKDVLGEDMELDFDMMINKAPFTNTETPWHQDAAYWINLPDKRSVTCWIALDKVNEDNGCMWFIPKSSNEEIFPHLLPDNGGALYCKVAIDEAEPIPLEAGGCTFHDGFTFHFSKGNITPSQRRALILNFRPAKMIKLERENGMDHTGQRKIRQ
ncbi:phytanoyl-CoA dioxygenase family protein [Algoriphagus aquimarinus]|uniref:phytanoyl-CoA dioxygenase family protein n=1 Tax=Algoriphagus aquimarinus TaxID=237018 RepID=UPI0030DA4B33|tara:strand:+ start:19717 stop:20436 length:720 start_codon:yes stop_codon:yes gene_type:complete